MTPPTLPEPRRIPDEQWAELRRRMEVGMVMRGKGRVTIHFDVEQVIADGEGMTLEWSNQERLPSISGTTTGRGG